MANRFRRQRGVRDGIVFIGVAREKAQAWNGRKVNGQFEFTRHKTVYVRHPPRRFDNACLTPVQPLSPKQMRLLREREHVSQTVFANYLNVTPNLVSEWERGQKRPSGPAFNLLSLVGKRD